MLTYSVLHEKGLLPEVIGAPVTKEPKVIDFERAIFGTKGSISAVFMLAVIDCFVSPIIVASIEVNARFVYIVIVELVALGGLIISIYNVIHHGVRLKKA